jgi:hypothetical protein
MNFTSYIALACLMLAAASNPPAQNTASKPGETSDKTTTINKDVVSKDSIKGDYIEVRTASVFAGACHYSAEYPSTGRDAILAMNIAGGKWNGVDLAGVRVVADVACSDNLAEAKAARKSEIVVDSSASKQQAQAVADMLRVKYHAALGDIVAVRRATVSFTHKADAYSVNAPGFASCDVQSMPDDECCKQPNMVWYSPVLPLTSHKVGYTITASYKSGAISDRWERCEENSAIYGSFAF